MKSKLAKFLEFVSVIAALVVAVLVVKNLSIESMLRGEEEPVTLAMTESGLPEDHIGLPAADDIPRIESLEAWDDLWQTSFVTIEPTGIVSTGVGARNNWISAYSNTSRRGGPRRKAEVSSTALDVFGDYAEYYLLRLPDKSYILAQMSTDDARKIKAGQEITLPVGRKAAVHRQALTQLRALCEEYDVYTDGVFYCINDKWNEEHSFMVLLVRYGIGALITLVLGTLLIMLVDKLLKVKD
ncbi:MAG: hypothetical protein NC337_04735 [Roseburia sp.]|nr:hypothetical protein [Roseburia sp.]